MVIIYDVGNNGTIYYTETISSKNTPFIPVANFTSNVTEGYAPLDVQFTNLSTDTTDLQWNFGDNSGCTYVANPKHIFTSTGLFNVVLIAKNSNWVFLPP